MHGFETDMHSRQFIKQFNITIHQEYHHVQHGQNIGIMDERIHHSQSMHGLSHQHTNMQYGVHRMLESHYE